jgi:Mn2+/Fe2+ NRAMP family transporter
MMDDMVNKRLTSAAMLAVTTVITALNATLIAQLALG